MRIRNLLIPATIASLAFGFTAAPAADTTTARPDALAQAATNPIGTLSWLPKIANEKATGTDIHRLVVVYDNSRDAASGADVPLIAKGAWGAKFFTDSVVAPFHNDPATTLTLAGHSSFVKSLDDAGAPTNLGDADKAFVGVTGNVLDATCDRVADGDPSDFSAAYTTTFTVPGDVAPAACQLVKSKTTDPATGTVTSTTLTQYVPGFWIDVRWPYEAENLPIGNPGQPGHTLAQVWYGAAPGFSTSAPNPAWFAAPGTSETVRNPGQHFFRQTVVAPLSGAGQVDSCQGNSSQPDSFETINFTVPAERPSDRLRIDLYPQGDWDLEVNGQLSGHAIVNESVTIAKVTTGQQLRIDACNFAGGPEAEVVLSWL